MPSNETDEVMRQLGELEVAVMSVLWSTDEALTVRRVLGALQRHPEPAYTTVMTVLDNLHRKTMVTRTREGRAWSYRPTQSREEFDAETMAQVLGATADPGATLLHFLDKVDPAQLHRLRQRLAEAADDS